MGILKRVFLVLLLLTGSVALFMTFWPAFGGKMSGARLQKLQASPQYHDDKFVNVVPQSPTSFEQTRDYLWQQFAGEQQRHPPAPIPVVKIPADFFDSTISNGLRAIWLGHASVYLELDGVRLLVDPVASDYPSPVTGLGPKRFHPWPVALEALPKIDAVMISHDHYDHLDMRTVQHLAADGSHFFVPLGVGAHLEKWQIPPQQFTELDWWEPEEFLGLKIVCTPARHYSGRGLLDHKDTFWSSWSIIGPKHRAFYSGDTGYSDHFEQIGERLGPFDLSVIKIGAYGPGDAWTDIHMTPEDSVRSHLALKARRMLPVHWGTFNVAFHAWDEPIERAVKAARDANVEMVTPRVGEIVTAGEAFVSADWWREVQ